MSNSCSTMLLVADEKVRITRFDFEPGQETGWHVHEHDYVITALTDCFMMIQHPDGTQTKSTHSLISSFQICPGRQNFEGSPPRLGHSRPSFPKTEEDKVTIKKDVNK